MKILLVLSASAYFVVSAALMQVVEPPEYPQGVYCTPKGVTTGSGQVIDPAHPCHCEHMTHSNDCEGQVEEHSNCKQYCHKDHCHCPVVCDPSPDVQENS